MNSTPPVEKPVESERQWPLGCTIGIGVFLVLLGLMVWPNFAPVPPPVFRLNEIQVWERNDQTLWIIAQAVRVRFRQRTASPPYERTPVALVVATYSPTGRIASNQLNTPEEVQQERHSIFWWAGKLYYNPSLDGSMVCVWRGGRFNELNDAETRQLIKDMGCDIVTSREWYGCIDRASRDDGAKLLMEVDQAMEGELCQALADSVTVTLEPRGNTARLVVSGTSPKGPWKEVVIDTSDF